MAQNDPIPSITHTYLRKDAQFFADGVWWISTPCPVHGLVDESVTWEEAKTPHHAGLIADGRHSQCNAENEERALYESGLNEIRVAEQLRDQQKANLEAATARATELRTVAEKQPKVRVAQIALSDAEETLRRHKHGMAEAERRVVETRKANTRR